MEKIDIIRSLSERTGGDIYLGVVGAVRTGKSTFIKRFMENLVIPKIEDEYERKRTLDELPQSAAGKQIMTTEPKFVPNQAAKVNLDGFDVNVRLVDCVGYVIKNAKGYEDENGPRMVHTPWYEEAIPFAEAAAIGTQKVIQDHSTIGIVVTTDGSITDLNRSDYVETERKVIQELKELGKPFIVLLNSTQPMMPEAVRISEDLKAEYDVPVLPVSVEGMREKDIYNILREALYEFPVVEVMFNMPKWIALLDRNNDIKKSYIETIRACTVEVDKLRDVNDIAACMEKSPFIEKAQISNVDTATGVVTINLYAPSNLYNDVLMEIMGCNIRSKDEFLILMQSWSYAKREFDQVKDALNMVKQTGYGIATPSLEDMRLESPEIVKTGSRYGVKLRAYAPSIHMIRVDVESTFEPIIGSEYQSHELINYLMRDYEKDPYSIWNSEIFGRSLSNIVQEGIKAKIALMPENVRNKLPETLQKVINKGSNGMITIIY